MKKAWLVLIVSGSLIAQAEDDSPATIRLSRVEATKALLESVEADGLLSSVKKIVEALTPKITAAAIKDSPFTIVGGRADQALVENDERNASGLVDPATAGEIGKAKAAKYGIWVVVSGFSDVAGVTQHSGLSAFRRTATLSVTLTINDLTTSEAIASSSHDFDVSHGPVPVMSEQAAVLERQRSDSFLLDSLCTDVAKMVIDECNDVLFPAIVLDVTDGVVTVSRGGAWCQVGDVLDVYAQPKKIQNKVTKKMIMVKGKKIGTLKVTSVETDHCQGTASETGVVEDCVVKKPDPVQL
ncbi:MAG: hypothetical protein PHV28_13880 [Kiritimatiellae bacterium]|nr:hypothetical protein [Kiritimatiellia bacterium]